MKKNVIIILGLFLLTTFSAQAGIKFGVKAGVNLAKASFSEDVIKPDNFTGFQAGVITEFTLPIIGLGMDAALLYSQDGVKLKDFGINELKTNNLLIPVNLKYKISLVDLIGVYATAGPYASIRLSDNIPDQVKNKSFGAGLNFGFGVELLSHLQVGANYQLGLTDNYSGINYNNNGVTVNDAKAKTRVWSITAAYFF